MTIFINKEEKSGFSSRVKISVLRLRLQIGGIYAIVADTNEIAKMALRLNAWHCGNKKCYWQARCWWIILRWEQGNGIHILAIGGRMSEGFRKMSRLKKEMFVHLQLAKRHFGYQADERLKPKCPLRALRSSARR